MFTGDVLSSPQSSFCKNVIKGAFINILNDLWEMNFVIFIYFGTVTSLCCVYQKETQMRDTHGQAGQKKNNKQALKTKAEAHWSQIQNASNKKEGDQENYRVRQKQRTNREHTRIGEQMRKSEEQKQMNRGDQLTGERDRDRK